MINGQITALYTLDYTIKATDSSRVHNARNVTGRNNHFPDLPAKMLEKKWRGFVSNSQNREFRSTIRSWKRVSWSLHTPLLELESSSKQLPECRSQVCSSRIHSCLWFVIPSLFCYCLFFLSPEMLCKNYLRWVCLLIIVDIVVWVGFFFVD